MMKHARRQVFWPFQTPVSQPRLLFLPPNRDSYRASFLKVVAATEALIQKVIKACC